MKKSSLSLNLFTLILLLLFSSCQSNSVDPLEDYSVPLDEKRFYIPVGQGQQLGARFTKPSGEMMNVVLLLPSLERSQLEPIMEARYLSEQFMVVRLDHSSFFELAKTRDQKQLVLASLEFLKSNLSKYNIQLQKLIAHGHFTGADEALYLALEREIDAVIINEPVYTDGLWREAVKRKNLNRVQSPILLISSEDNARPIRDCLRQLEAQYHQCTSCNPGSQFVYHSGSPREWNNEAVWGMIFDFVAEKG